MLSLIVFSLFAFLPTDVSLHSNLAVIQSSGYNSKDSTLTLRSVKANNHGYVQVSTRDSHYFEFDDGTPFFPVGVNKGWVLNNLSSRGDNYEGSKDFKHKGWTAERYFQEMKAHGMNLVRIWMCSWHIHIEPQLGVYDESEAAKVDYLLELAEEYDVYVMLTLLTFTDFSNIHGNHWDWYNPYNSAKGGPCAEPADFFTNDIAKYYIKKRFNYILDRWGENRRIAMWEFWNEVSLVPRVTDDVSKAWHEDVAQVFRQNDTHRRPLTTSFHGDVQQLWDKTIKSSAIDVIQIHTYKTDNSIQIAQSASEYVKYYLDYGKPIMIGEYGSKNSQEEPEHCSNGIWAAVASGAGATSIRWASNILDGYGDLTDDMFNRYLFFQRFVHDVSWPTLNITSGTGSISGARNVRMTGLQGERFALAWVQHTVSWGTISGAKIEFPDLSDGDYSVYIYDDSTGTYLDWYNVTVSSGNLIISLPHFTEHLAVKVISTENAFPVPLLTVAPQTLSIKVAPGNNQTHSLTISEAGGAVGISNVSLSTHELNWITFDNSNFDVPAGTGSTVSMSVSVPSNAEIKDYPAVIRVETENDGIIDVPLTVMVRASVRLPIPLLVLLSAAVATTTITIWLFRKRKTVS